MKPPSSILPSRRARSMQRMWSAKSPEAGDSYPNTGRTELGSLSLFSFSRLIPLGPISGRTWWSGVVLPCFPSHLPEVGGCWRRGASASLPSFDFPRTGVQAAPWLPTSCFGTWEWKTWRSPCAVSSTLPCCAWDPAWHGRQGENRPMLIWYADRSQELALLPPCSNPSASEPLFSHVENEDSHRCFASVSE